MVLGKGFIGDKMMPGLGGLDPRQMKRMMQQLGLKQEELNVKKVIFELEGKKLVIENPQVSAIEMQGKKTYTVMGEAKEEASIPEEDIKMVSEQAKVSGEKARESLEESSGDIAEAIAKLKK